MRLRIWLMAAAIGISAAQLSACATMGGQGSGADGAGGKPPMLFNITSGPEDAHAVTMALQLAGHAVADGHRVVLFFNVRGVRVASSELDPTLAFGAAPPIAKLLAELMAKGVEVHVCPHCLEALGIQAAALVPKAQVTSRAALFAHIRQRPVVFSY